MLTRHPLTLQAAYANLVQSLQAAALIRILAEDRPEELEDRRREAVARGAA